MKLTRCLCFDIRTGVLIIGWLGLSFSISTLVSYSYVAANMETLIESLNITAYYADYSVTVYTGYAWATVAMSCIDIFSCSLLLYGTVKKHHLLLLPWLIDNGFAIIVISLVSLLGIIALLFSGLFGVTFIVGCIIGPLIVVYIYMFMVVQTHYKTLKEDGTGAPPILPTQAKEMVVGYNKFG